MDKLTLLATTLPSLKKMNAEEEERPGRLKRPHCSTPGINDAESHKLPPSKSANCSSDGGGNQDSGMGSLLVEMRGDAEIWKSYKNRIEAKCSSSNVPEKLRLILQDQLDSTQEGIGNLERLLQDRNNQTASTSTTRAETTFHQNTEQLLQNRNNQAASISTTREKITFDQNTERLLQSRNDQTAPTCSTQAETIIGQNTDSDDLLSEERPTKRRRHSVETLQSSSDEHESEIELEGESEVELEGESEEEIEDESDVELDQQGEAASRTLEKLNNSKSSSVFGRVLGFVSGFWGGNRAASTNDVKGRDKNRDSLENADEDQAASSEWSENSDNSVVSVDSNGSEAEDDECVSEVNGVEANTESAEDDDNRQSSDDEQIQSHKDNDKNENNVSNEYNNRNENTVSNEYKDINECNDSNENNDSVENDDSSEYTDSNENDDRNENNVSNENSDRNQNNDENKNNVGNECNNSNVSNDSNENDDSNENSDSNDEAHHDHDEDEDDDEVNDKDQLDVTKHDKSSSVGPLTPNGVCQHPESESLDDHSETEDSLPSEELELDQTPMTKRRKGADSCGECLVILDG